MPPPPIRRTISYRWLRTFPPASALGFVLRGASSPAREVAPASAGSGTISSVPISGFGWSLGGPQVLLPRPRSLDRSLPGGGFSMEASSASTREPQLPQKFSSSATSAPHSLQAGITTFQEDRKNYFASRNRKKVLPTMISSPSFNGWRSPGFKRRPRFTNVP